MEQRRTLGELSPAAALLAGFFLSAMTRTGGFNSVDIGALDPATWLGMDVLMFIGGGPAGTAGGLKVTTFAVLFFIIYTELRGDGAVNALGKRLPRSAHRQAITVALVSVAVVVIATLALLVMTEFTLDRVLFEVMAAFSTVRHEHRHHPRPAGRRPDHPDGADVSWVGSDRSSSRPDWRCGAPTRLYELPKERPIIG